MTWNGAVSLKNAIPAGGKQVELIIIHNDVYIFICRHLHLYWDGIFQTGDH